MNLSLFLSFEVKNGRIMKYKDEFKHLCCWRLLRPAYVTFFENWLQMSKCHNLSDIYRTQYIHEIINLDSTCQNQFTLYISMWDTLSFVITLRGSKFILTILLYFSSLQYMLTKLYVLSNWILISGYISKGQYWPLE